MFDQVELPVWPSGLGRTDAAKVLTSTLTSWIRSEPLRALATQWGAAPPTHTSTAELYGWFDTFSAAHWDFRRGAERNLAAAAELSDEQRNLAFNVAQALGMVDARLPTHDSYDAVLVLGGLVRACIVRPRYAASLVEGGLEVGEAVALGGFRKLDGDEIELARLFDIDAADEFGAMFEGMRRAFGVSAAASVEGTSGTANHDWRVARFNDDPRLSVIAAPSSEPGTRRANSVDTYNWWAGRVDDVRNRRLLVITNPIYVPYQGAGAIQVFGLGHGTAVETIGVSQEAADLGGSTQTFTAANYLQEIRSAIRGYMSLHDAMSSSV